MRRKRRFAAFSFPAAVGLAAAFLLVGLALPGASVAAGSQQITSTGPLTGIVISDTLNCQVYHQDDLSGTSGEFFRPTDPIGACGTFLFLPGSPGTLYGPAFVPADPSPPTAFTPVSQSAVTGTGTTSDPYKLVTVVDAANGSLRITETDTYVTGQESYRTEVQVKNQTSVQVNATLYRAGDCYLQNSDSGFGLLDLSSGAVACRSDEGGVPGGRIEQWFPLTSGSSAYEAHFNEVWNWIAGGQPFPNTCLCDQSIDNGAGLSWSLTLAAGAAASFAHTTSISPAAVTTTKTADSSTAAPGGLDGYTITITNPRATPVTLTKVTDALPAGFSYRPGSSTGATNADPSVSGQTLSWAGPISVPAHGSTFVHFNVNVSATPGQYLNNASAESADSAVAPTGPTAQIDVVQIAPQTRYTLTVDVSGSGIVSGNGLQCTANSCSGQYLPGTVVTLDATPGPGNNFKGWEGDCPDAPVPCSIVIDGSKVVKATFTSDPVLGDLPKPAQPEPPTNALNVSVAGNGTVKGSVVTAAGFGPTKAADSASISCGVQGLSCFAQAAPDTTVQLTASAAAGYAFRGWGGGGCSGTSLTCRLLLSRVRFVTAKFAPKSPARTVTAVLKQPAFNVRWRASVGTGTLAVGGQVGKPAKVTLQLRRQLRGQTTSGELFTVRRAVRGGSFTLRQKLPSRIFRRGARLLPGGFIVTLKGAARSYTVPLQIRTTQLRPPREGVVRLSYASTSEGGAPVKAVTGGARSVWAVFRFESQPKTNDLQVVWYFPNGKALQFKPKTNRPVITTELTSNLPIPAGKWHVELRAAGKLVKRQTITIVR